MIEGVRPKAWRCREESSVRIATGVEYDEVVERVRELAPGAQELRALACAAGEAYHDFWLVPERGVVFHAYSTPEASQWWHMDELTVGEAGEIAQETLHWQLAALADPTMYREVPDAVGKVERDLEALADYLAIDTEAWRAAVREGGASRPDTVTVVTDGLLLERMRELRADIAWLALLRGCNIAARFGRGHGAGAAAARVMGISSGAAKRALRAEDEFAERLRRRVAELGNEDSVG